MNYSIVFSKRANKDLQEILTYYNDQSLNAAQNFLKEFIICTDTISTLPNGFPISFSKVRKMVMPKYPFNIFYKTNHVQKEAVIARIWHQKRSAKGFDY